MQKQPGKKYIVEVLWVSPHSGRLAPSGRYLGVASSMPDKLWSGAPYSRRDEDICRGPDTWVFFNREDAEAFKHLVVEFYTQNPQYFVIDDEGRCVLDEDGKPIVAWKPDPWIWTEELEEVETL
jgi:hypothetical protein